MKLNDESVMSSHYTVMPTKCSLTIHRVIRATAAMAERRLCQHVLNDTLSDNTILGFLHCIILTE